MEARTTVPRQVRWWWCWTALQDPGNAGAIVRAAEAFGATGVLFLKGTASPYNPKTLRASAGSLFRVPFLHGMDAPPWRAPRCGRTASSCIAAVPAFPPREALTRPRDLTGRCALIIGSEAHGVCRRTGARRRLDVSIPTVGVESLNAAMAAGILLYEARRQRMRAAVSLFDSTPPDAPEPPGGSQRPLAERMRPERLEDFVGQEHILGPGKPLRRQIERDELTSIILWGPPGVGKTTLAHLIARVTRCEFIPFSAVLSGIKEIKAVMADAERLRRVGRRTILFIDEIHRFNKAQQDAFLPYVERGDIILIGATTENPSFEVISALLSRSRCTRCARSPCRRSSRCCERALPVVGLDAPRRTAGADRASTPTATRARRTTRWKRPPRRRADGVLDRGGRAGRHAAQGAALRQRRRRALQPDFGAAQVACGRAMRMRRCTG